MRSGEGPVQRELPSASRMGCAWGCSTVLWRLQGGSCWPAANCPRTELVPPCACCDPAVPLLPPCLHSEPVWCIGAVRACPMQTKLSQEVQQAGPAEKDASSGRSAWQGPGGLCFRVLQCFSSWKAPLKEGRSAAPSQVWHSPLA